MTRKYLISRSMFNRSDQFSQPNPVTIFSENFKLINGQFHEKVRS
jgi:hypothetical protein